MPPKKGGKKPAADGEGGDDVLTVTGRSYFVHECLAVAVDYLRLLRENYGKACK